jgi:hypothetical protein
VFLDLSFSAIFALFLSSPILLGGLALTPHTIGLVLGFSAIFHGLFQAFFFARIHRRFEPRNIYAVSIAAFIPIYLSMPIMNALARRAGRITPLVWILLALVEMACTFSYTAVSKWFVSMYHILLMTHGHYLSLYVHIHHEGLTFSIRSRSNKRSCPDHLVTHGGYWACSHNLPCCCVSTAQPFGWIISICCHGSGGLYSPLFGIVLTDRRTTMTLRP